MQEQCLEIQPLPGVIAGLESKVSATSVDQVEDDLEMIVVGRAVVRSAQRAGSALRPAG
jgi:hypothetical protein